MDEENCFCGEVAKGPKNALRRSHLQMVYRKEKVNKVEGGAKDGAQVRRSRSQQRSVLLRERSGSTAVLEVIGCVS